MNPIQSAGEAMPAEPTSELIVDRVQRLAEELQAALGEWANGQFSAVIYPADHPCGIHYRAVGTTPERRLEYAREAYQMAAKAIDPTATEWWVFTPADEETPCRFGLWCPPDEGSRPMSSILSIKISDVEDMILSIRNLNEVLFMAAGHPNVIGEATGALQAVCDEINNKLLVVADKIEEIRGELA